MSIRPKIQEIVDNIEKFESRVEYKYEYKKIRIDAIWERLYIDGIKIKLSFWEKRYLFKPFWKIAKENEKYLKNCDKQIQNKALNSISFKEGKDNE